MSVLVNVLTVIYFLVGIGLVVVVALQTNKTEGLGSLLAGGGGGGGKVGRDLQLDTLSKYLCYGWLCLVALTAWLRHRFI